MDGRRVFVIFNERSGTAGKLGVTASQITERFSAAGFSAEVATDLSAGIATLVQQGLNSGADAIVAAGGDGTITAVAENLVGAEMPLLILPLGTANLLARDLGLALDPTAWFENLEALEERQIDVGSVNGRPFLHNVAIGMAPGIAAGREKVRQNQNVISLAAFMGFLARRFARTGRMSIDVSCDNGTDERWRVSSVAVGNNVYDEGFGQIFTRQSLQGGKLSLYLLKHISVLDAMRLVLGMLLGNWHDHEALSVREAQSVKIGLRKNQVKAMLDGEPVTLETPLHFRIDPGALSVLVPGGVVPTPLTVEVEEQTSAAGVPTLAGV